MTMAALIKENISLRMDDSSEVYPLSSWWEAWQCTGRHGAGEIAESSTSGSAGNRELA